jgi:hypothetical protein
MRWWGQDYLFLPKRYLIDLKTGGSEKLSFFKNISDVNAIFILPQAILIETWDFTNTRPLTETQAFSLQRSVGNLYSDEIMISVVKRGLNPHLREYIFN